jgi:hypothetical protein
MTKSCTLFPPQAKTFSSLPYTIKPLALPLKMPESHETTNNVHISGTRPFSYHHDGLRNSEYVELIDKVNIRKEVATKYDYESKSTQTNWRETKEGREEEQRQIRELQKVVHRGLESAEREAKDCLEEAKASREE